MPCCVSQWIFSNLFSNHFSRPCSASEKRSSSGCQTSSTPRRSRKNPSRHILDFYFCRGAVAHLVGRPSKVLVWCNSTVGLNPERETCRLFLSDHAAALGGRKFVEKVLAPPSVGERRNKREVWRKKDLYFLVPSCYLSVLDVLDQHFQASVHFPLTRVKGFKPMTFQLASSCQNITFLTVICMSYSSLTHLKLGLKLSHYLRHQ